MAAREIGACEKPEMQRMDEIRNPRGAAPSSGLGNGARRGRIERVVVEQLRAVVNVLHHALRREAAPLEELLAQLGEEAAVHPVPASVVAAEALEDELDFVDVGELAGMHEQHQVLANAEVKGREP